MSNDIELTPMMKQFLDLKAKHPDAVMLFRCGDFYETYSTDAIIAAEILGITLTKRANGKGKTIEMAGFPHHALDTYLPKLIPEKPENIIARSPAAMSISGIPRKARGGSAISRRARTPAKMTIAIVKPTPAAKP